MWAKGFHLTSQRTQLISWLAQSKEHPVSHSKLHSPTLTSSIISQSDGWTMLYTCGQTIFKGLYICNLNQNSTKSRIGWTPHTSTDVYCGVLAHRVTIWRFQSRPQQRTLSTLKSCMAALSSAGNKPSTEPLSGIAARLSTEKNKCCASAFSRNRWATVDDSYKNSLHL